MQLGRDDDLRRAYEPWRLAAVKSGDVRLDALARAVLAPSSHNTQPWTVELGGRDRVALFADAQRRLPHADPLHRQTVLSVGGFLELLTLACGEREHVVDATLAGPDTAEAAIEGRQPLVTMAVRPSAATPDPLAAAIARRHTNRRPFARGRDVPPATLAAISRAARRDGCDVVWITEPSRIRSLAGMCREAMAIDVANRARNEETAAWFRFGDHEIAARADGFGLAQGGTTGIAKWIAETFLLSRRRAADPNGAFAKKAVDLCHGQAATASAFGLLLTDGNDLRRQIDAGRAWVRVQLAAELADVRSQPLSQILQEYPEMTSLREQMRAALNVPAGQTVQMLFRVGYAAPTAHAPRRPVSAVVRANAPA